MKARKLEPRHEVGDIVTWPSAGTATSSTPAPPKVRVFPALFKAS